MTCLVTPTMVAPKRRGPPRFYLAHLMPDWINIWKPLPRGFFVDQGHAGRIAIIRRREIAPAQQLNAAGRYISGRNRQRGSEPPLLQLLRLLFAFQHNCIESDIASRRKRSRGAG